VSEVGSAIIASTLTFLALFLPFLFVPGLSALLFKELVLVVAGIVIVSLIVALTLTPVLTRALIKGGESGKMSAIAGRFDRVMNTLTQVYSQLLQLCLTHKWKTVLTCVLVFSAGIFLAGKAGSEFLPKVDDGRVMVKLKMPSGTAVSEIDRILMQLEEKIRDLPEIESIFTLAGGKVWGLYTYEIANEGELDVQLVPKSRRSISTEEFIKKIKPMVGKIKVPGAKIPVMQMKIKGIRKVGDQEVEIKIKGARIQPIFEFAREMAARLKETPGLTNVTLSMDMSKPEYRIYIDRAKASALGITVKEAADTLQGLVQGSVATRYREGADYYDIRVMVPSESLKSKFDGFVKSIYS
jgi:multidrug efflux pump subunit AcrB